MKKALIICGLSAAMLLVCLFACSSQADEPPAPSAAQTQPVETPTPTETPEPEETSPQVEPMSVTKRLPTQDELLGMFQTAYDMGQMYKDFGDDDFVLAQELDELHFFFEVDSEFNKPADLDEQYKAWRPGGNNQTQAPAAVQLFTDCNQTLYAVDTVNIRASYSTSSTKLGSLTRGQSITCTGTGINDASGWSRVQLSDGTVAYMVSSYLSTTMPAQNPGGGSGGTQQTTPPPANNPSGGQSNIVGGTDWNKHHIDPTQSSVFQRPDNPWDTDYKLDLGD